MREERERRESRERKEEREKGLSGNLWDGPAGQDEGRGGEAAGDQENQVFRLIKPCRKARPRSIGKEMFVTKPSIRANLFMAKEL